MSGETELDPGRATDQVKGFIQRKVEESGSSGVVVGLSGGIDSSVSSALAVEALGASSVHGLVMPAGSSDAGNIRDARMHAESFGISCREVEVEPVVEAFLDTYPDEVSDREAVGNVRARARMVLEYLDANLHDRLVLGTGNRTELLLGYFTKYGDGGVDVLPIGGLYKTEVREVGRNVGVAEHVIEKPPTAGLWEGQTDEGELGAAYPTIDRILRRLVDQELSVEETAREVGVDADLVRRFSSMHQASQHKREVPPYPSFDRQ